MNMFPDPAPALTKLTPVAAEFNDEVVRHMNDAIAALNERLRGLGVKLESWLTPGEDHIMLGWARVGRRWQLAARKCNLIRRMIDRDDDGQPAEYFEYIPGSGYTTVALTRAPLEIRYRALILIEPIIEQIRQDAGGAVDTVRSTWRLADELTSRIAPPLPVGRRRFH